MWVNVLTILVLFVFGLIGQMLFGEVRCATRPGNESTCAGQDEQLAADTAYMEFGTGGNSRVSSCLHVRQALVCMNMLCWCLRALITVWLCAGAVRQCTPRHAYHISGLIF